MGIQFQQLGTMEYGKAWDLQEGLLAQNLEIKKRNRDRELGKLQDEKEETRQYFLLCEHPPVFTIGKSGALEHLLVNEERLKQQGIGFFRTNRGGDITFHGPGQVVGYPILDLEQMKPDLVWYMRNLEEMIIRVLADYGIVAGRSAGETGVWLDADIPHRARKICAMGVRTSRWITMHGFALNVNTRLDYFNMIVPCGIQGKQVSSMEKELGRTLAVPEVEEKICRAFCEVFEVEVSGAGAPV